MDDDNRSTNIMDAWESESGQVYMFKLWGMMTLPHLCTSEDDVTC